MEIGALERPKQGLVSLIFELLLAVDSRQALLATVRHWALAAHPAIAITRIRMCSSGRIYLKIMPHGPRHGIIFIGGQTQAP